MYSELQVATNFSFLRGASHPYEVMWRAAELGYSSVGVTDYNTLAGIVRAHTAAKEAGVQLLVGCRLDLDFDGDLSRTLDDRASPYCRSSVLLYPLSRRGYATLCRLITTGKHNVSKNDFFLNLADLLPHLGEFSAILIPPFFQTRLHYAGFTQGGPAAVSRNEVFLKFARLVREACPDPKLLSVALTLNYGPSNVRLVAAAVEAAKKLEIPVVATNDVHYHIPERKPLHDVVTCIREGLTVQQAGSRLFQNGERHLKDPREMRRLFRDLPHAVSRTQEIAEMARHFSLDQLTYTYPEEICPAGKSPLEQLSQAVEEGSRARYPNGVPDHVKAAVAEELTLINELQYEKYFLTCHDIVSFARSKGILCQGRGAAANSAVCYCLGITSVDPTQIDLLFARFVSKERQEPPDIDIDFEHERREEVIQYIYGKYGRDRAAIAASVITFRARSAVREVGKALGLSLELVDRLAKEVHRWTDYTVTDTTLRELGLSPDDETVRNTLALTQELIGFPRHLSQHVGGFIISNDPLCEIVPIINTGMESRTMIEWDKNDIEELGMLKIDILALGMLTCIRKALDLIGARCGKPLALHEIPREDPSVYDMLCVSDTIGVFQVESRAQMSMLPRLRPRCFYDIVIEVAIVRPGPIQGNMVHPYLRRRGGLERPYYPDARVERILGKTLGVPIFQEQAMRLAITLANFSPGEAEKLRRAMAAWKTHKGVIEAFKEKITRGMLANGYSEEFADTCLNQIKGFSEYGFPESHAASFALLVYASAWIKRHYPAEFACALLNSQPMGFYAPAQIVRDAQRHGVSAAPIDANKSGWDCSVTYCSDSKPTLRLGLRLVSGLREESASRLQASVERDGEFSSVSELWGRNVGASKAALTRLAHADAFGSVSLNRRPAHWEIQELPPAPAPLDALFSPRTESRAASNAARLPESTLQREMFTDYATTGLSLRAHPLQFLRPHLDALGAYAAERLSPKHGLRPGARASAAGLAIIRQRPGTAKGVVFLTLEDETGSFNVIVRPALFEQVHRTVMMAAVLLVSGKLERVGEIAYIDAGSVEPLDGQMAQVRSSGIPSRSYSY